VRLTEQMTSEGDTLKNDYAEAFRVIDYENFTQIDIVDPATNETIYSYGIGDSIRNGLVDLGKNIESIAALSATHVGMLKRLNLEIKIKGVSSAKYLCNTKNEEEDWIEYGDLGNSDPELFIAHRPTLIMYSGFKLDHPVLTKIEKIGIPTFVNYDWKETHPLGRAEWLKVFGILCDVQDEAQEVFNSIKRNYLQLVKRIQNDTTSPSVLVGTLYGDVFNVPAGNSYMSKMLSDANVDYIYNKTQGTGSLNLSLEEVIIKNQETDFLINIAASSKKAVSEMNDKFELLNAYQNDKMFSYYENVNCFWERSAVAPEEVLYDLIHIFHSDLFSDSTLYFYNQIQ